MKYHFNIRNLSLAQPLAGKKAVDDTSAILRQLGYEDMEIGFYGKAYLLPFNCLKLLWGLAGMFIKVERGAQIVVQYPLTAINRYFGLYIKLCRLKNCRFVCVIHDIDSLRSFGAFRTGGASAAKREIRLLNAFSVVIAHTDRMSEWLRNQGLRADLVTLGMFDYLAGGRTTQLRPGLTRPFKLAVAGNLGKSGYIYQLAAVAGPQAEFVLYGPNADARRLSAIRGTSWCGVYSPDRIIHVLSAHFGIVWDGESLTSIQGAFGAYLQFNSPHKVSMFMAAGLPVIVPKEAAISRMILDNHLGFAVSGLDEVPAILSSVDAITYQRMLDHVHVIRERVIRGSFLEEAVRKAERLLDDMAERYTG